MCRSAPAPGYRDFGRTGYEGMARHIGFYGYSWSAAASGTYCVFLDFDTQLLDPTLAHGRGHGFQLRCLSE